MPKRKEKKIGFHKNFTPATAKNRKDALGTFPFEHRSNESRERMLLKSAEIGQPSLALLASSNPGSNIVSTPMLALSDVNEPKLYKATPKSETGFAIPKPRDELDWLAQVPEEGQTFDQYVSFLTTRTTGRIRPIANAQGQEILLLPIVRVDQVKSPGCDSLDPASACDYDWPAHGPSLEPLIQYTRAFFDRSVRLLPAAQVYVQNESDSTTSTSGTKKKKKKTKQAATYNSTKESLAELGKFASSTQKGKFKLFLPSSSSSSSSSSQNNNVTKSKSKSKRKTPSSSISSSTTGVNIAGRSDPTSGKVQLQVISLLDELSRYRYSRQNTNSTSGNEEADFCIMGITMEDLYDGPTDLFCAGMAFGGDKVAVFSFHRYHPFLKMHPQQWHHYGYSAEGVCDGYSYYNDDDQNPLGLQEFPPSIVMDDDDDDACAKARTEFFRRSSKLLTHELGHLYGLDHCIHNRCLMMGTGHLVEDFNAPSHLCGVCLRKLQWRTGFAIRERYKLLATAFENMGLGVEENWVTKQLNHLSSHQ